jgi:hypothetical protein
MAEEQKTMNGWNEWSKFVLKELERLNACYERLDLKVDALSEKFTARADIISKDFNCKVEATDRRITNLYVKVAGLSSAMAILMALIFKYIVK